MKCFKDNDFILIQSPTKLLLIEDGSVDTETLKGLPNNVKVIVYRKGSQKPQIIDLGVKK